ncbi:MAG TPA: GNAT family N-acetyltransferase [Thermoanaerobaculia bacterium]|nr:GNAT family N-acetyltransferase [Thermoanaerobaculia bacterium]
MPIPLLTPRLELRDFRPDDFAAVHAYGSDPKVTLYTAFGPNTEEQTRAFLDRVAEESAAEPREHHNLAVVDRESGALFGGCGLIGRGERTHEIGYVLHRDWWGRGFATEIVRALLDFGFGELAAHRIYARVAPENEASSRVLLKHGFRLEGHLRKECFVRGEWQDSLLYAILEEDRGELQPRGLTPGLL